MAAPPTLFFSRPVVSLPAHFTLNRLLLALGKTGINQKEERTRKLLTLKFFRFLQRILRIFFFLQFRFSSGPNTTTRGILCMTGWNAQKDGVEMSKTTPQHNVVPGIRYSFCIALHSHMNWYELFSWFNINFRLKWQTIKNPKVFISNCLSWLNDISWGFCTDIPKRKAATSILHKKAINANLIFPIITKTRL